MSLLNDARHIAIEKRHNERVDVRAIDIGIGHDDYLVVAELVSIGLKVILAVIHTKADTDGLDDIHHRLCLEHTMALHLLHIQDLTTKRQNSLGVSVAALLG